jgi:lysophospholipid acyltransferase (LPLAT)-like uncharacterized protein
MLFGKRLIKNSRWVRTAIGALGAGYLRLVWKTSRVTIEPADLYEQAEPEQPIIIAMWHGQHFMMPFIRRHHRVKVLVSHHADGDINAIAAERLGIGTVRGSGDHQRQFGRKGGVAAFKEMLDVLADSCNMALTADVPKISRVAGRGIIMLARESGRPIYPVCFTTSRRIVLKNWDRTVINLPFSRCAIIAGEPIHVRADADAQAVESARCTLEAALNAVTERAFAVVDRV